MRAQIQQALLLSLTLLALCGLGYPVFLTGISHVLMPEQAAGSLIVLDGKAIGSRLIGQDFKDPRFMKCRPSAVNYNTFTDEDKAGGAYPGVASGSKNFAPSNPELALRVEKDMAAFLAAHPDVRQKDIPTDLLTASGSGLDPHISPAAAAIQIPAMVEHTGLPKEQLEQIVRQHSTGRLLDIFGEDTVNVLLVNVDIARALGMVK